MAEGVKKRIWEKNCHAAKARSSREPKRIKRTKEEGVTLIPVKRQVGRKGTERKTPGYRVFGKRTTTSRHLTVS